ncbi:response regulator transcription factor [Thermococcus sp. MV5]|nr:response regulator transcription factor [Thermococcus sp. MV5]NJE27027.1 response regulator transcription factor [Thermococcus sp. MV5]
MKDEVKVVFGETWSGFEFAKVKKYKRKTGYRVDLVRRTWRGRYITLDSKQFETLEKVVDFLGKIISRNEVIRQLEEQGWIEVKELSEEEENAILEEVSEQ